MSEWSECTILIHRRRTLRLHLFSQRNDWFGSLKFCMWTNGGTKMAPNYLKKIIFFLTIFATIDILKAFLASLLFWNMFCPLNAEVWKWYTIIQKVPIWQKPNNISMPWSIFKILKYNKFKFEFHCFLFWILINQINGW